MQRWPAILLLALFIQACDDAKFSRDDPQEAACGIKALLSETSADGEKLLKLIEGCNDSARCYTQVLLEYNGIGSGVYAVNGRNLNIHVRWIDNHSILIETRKAYVPTQKWPEVWHWGIKSTVRYKEQ